MKINLLILFNSNNYDLIYLCSFMIFEFDLSGSFKVKSNGSVDLPIHYFPGASGLDCLN